MEHHDFSWLSQLQIASNCHMFNGKLFASQRVAHFSSVASLAETSPSSTVSMMMCIAIGYINQWSLYLPLCVARDVYGQKLCANYVRTMLLLTFFCLVIGPFIHVRLMSGKSTCYIICFVAIDILVSCLCFDSV